MSRPGAPRAMMRPEALRATKRPGAPRALMRWPAKRWAAVGGLVAAAALVTSWGIVALWAVWGGIIWGGLALFLALIVAPGPTVATLRRIVRSP